MHGSPFFVVNRLLGCQPCCSLLHDCRKRYTCITDCYKQKSTRGSFTLVEIQLLDSDLKKRPLRGRLTWLLRSKQLHADNRKHTRVHLTCNYVVWHKVYLLIKFFTHLQSKNMKHRHRNYNIKKQGEQKGFKLPVKMFLWWFAPQIWMDGNNMKLHMGTGSKAVPDELVRGVSYLPISPLNITM